MIKVLVVDDSALVRKLLGEIFATEAEFQVEFARTGVEALEKIAMFNPNVVTLDVNMPVMDGLACLDRIMLESPRPVVMVSSATAAGAETTFEAMRLGAVDVVAKPSGAMSLDIHEMTPRLIAAVRSAASARLPAALRLKDRIAHRAGGSTAEGAARKKKTGVHQASKVTLATGQGLIVVGVSTGGPPALEKLLMPLAASFGWPIVIAQHMPSTFTGQLAKRLDRMAALTVSEVAQLTRLEPGHAYVARGDADIVISSRPEGLVAMPAPPKKDYLWKPSVDRLVRTAMAHAPASQIVGVMLTGMGNDGAKAMAELKAAGGRTIAQSEDSAVIWGMPGELAKAGGADHVVPVEDMASLLGRMTPSCP